MNTIIRHLLCAAGAFLACAAPCSAAPLYHLTSLGFIPDGGQSSVAYAINSEGQVAGYANYDGAGGDNDVFLWTGSSPFQNIGTLPGFKNSLAFSINDSTAIVGYSQQFIGNSPVHAFLWTPSGGMQDLGTPGGNASLSTEAYAINNSGEIAGIVTGGPATAPVTWTSAGGWQYLPTLSSGASGPRAINSSGVMAGFSETASGVFHAVTWANGAIDDLGTLPGFNSEAEGINDSSEVIGILFPTGSNSTTGFTWTSVGGIQQLPLPPFTPNAFPTDINASGQIVGYGGNGAMLWSNGQVFELNNLLDSTGQGWNLGYAFGINNDGGIVGYGTNPSGFTEGFLLTPIVPEPSAIILMAFGAAGLGCSGLRRRATRGQPASA